jgi:hypothetical protein
MPLKKSASKAALQDNIRTEISAGKKPATAVAIGYATKRKAQGKKGKS